MLDFKVLEEKILSFWKEHNIFEKSLDQTRKGKRFVFFEGPPTANGKPHIGHFLTRIYKDFYGRYKTMRGHFVLRKAGWDTHGLPVEIEVEKELGFKNKKDIENYGIAPFNRKAKESVWKYKKEWESLTERMGFWINLDDLYVTYENKYMESLWYIFEQISKRGLLVEDHKVVPFCVRCGTPLSSHEVAQEYKTVKDQSVYIKFKVINPEKINLLGSVYILAWTTTPWTLPGNVALAVGSEISYAVAKKGNETYILAEALVKKVLGEDSAIQKVILGKQVSGLEYEPLFDIPKLKTETAYKVYEADFVSTDDGTGVVHTAVMYGEDDYILGTKLGLPKFHTVDETGKFFDVDEKLDGKYVKDPETENVILSMLKEKNLLLKTEMHEHEYPFCWRCHNPLLYYAKHSWFIKMSAINKEMVANNSKINWIPEHIKEGRFGQWLKEGKDWAISRERYWGTPLPFWKCQRCHSVRVVGSMKELERAAVGSKNTYYLMRHGSSTRMERDQFINNWDLAKDTYHLTEEGEKEAGAGALQVQAQEGIDFIFASPFFRTLETAKIAGQVLHHEVKPDERLREFIHGPGCEGKPLTACPFYNKARHFDDKEPGGESFNDVRLRLLEFMNELESKYKNKKILIVGHGHPLWLLEKMAQGLNEKEIATLSKEGISWYPGLAEAKKISWRNIPRNEYGELDLHRPLIDDIFLRCAKCRSATKRIPELADVWFDSGAMPYAQWHYPFENKDIFKRQYPADYIVEGIDQTRGWFYTLLAISTLLEKDIPNRNVMVLGHTLDEKGRKMSKSIGNVIAPSEMMDKYGVDATRWYFYATTSPGENKIVVPKEIEDKLKNFLFTLMNCLRFYELYKGQEAELKVTQLDKWILSRTHRVIRDVTESLDRYDVTSAARLIESFVIEDFSNWWLRRSRKRKEALSLLRMILLQIAALLAPFTPYIADEVYRHLEGGKESVHLESWPVFKKKWLDDDLEAVMDEVKEIVRAGLGQRKENNIKVRQPLASVSVKRSKKLHRDLTHLITEELNVKKVIYQPNQEKEIALDLHLTPALVQEGLAREMMRQIQEMRKEAKYHFDEKVFASWKTEDKDLIKIAESWKKDIEAETLCETFERRSSDVAYDVKRDIELAPSKHISLGVWKKK